MALCPGRQRLSATPIITKGLVYPRAKSLASKSATTVGSIKKLFTHLDNQAHGECDFVDVVTGEKFDAKIPIDKRQGQMIGSRKGDVSPFQNRSIPSSKGSAPHKMLYIEKTRVLL